MGTDEMFGSCSLDCYFDARTGQLNDVDVGVPEEKEDPQPGTIAGMNSNWGPLKGRYKTVHLL
jgi:hypothetical protein